MHHPVCVLRVNLRLIQDLNLMSSSFFPQVDEEEIQDTKEGKKKRLLDAPRAQNFFHFEYNLFPDDEEPVKTDVVTFGMAAKIYTERQEPKVLKTWVEGEHTWVAWTHW